MKKIRFPFTIFSMCLLPTTGVTGTISAAVYLGVPIDPILVLSSWMIIFGIYGINNFTDKEDIVNVPEKKSFYTNTPFLLHLVILSLVCSLLLLIFTHRLALFHLVIVFVGVAYSCRILPVFSKDFLIKYVRIKDIPILKGIAVATIWGNGFFLINFPIFPGAMPPTCNIFNVVLLITSFTVVTFVNTTFLDIPDIIGDRIANVPTIPALWGIKNTMIYGIGLPSIVWLATILVLYGTGHIENPIMIFLLVNISFPALYIAGYFMNLYDKKVTTFIADCCDLIFTIGVFVLALYKVN